MATIEIFKTNVERKRLAQQLVDEMAFRFPDYIVNFDLEDCDRILRVESSGGEIEISGVIGLLKKKRIECKLIN